MFETRTDLKCIFYYKMNSLPAQRLVRYLFFRARWNRLFTVVATFISGTMFAHPWPPSRTECTFTLCTLNGFLFSQSSAVSMLSLSLRQTLRVSTFVLCFRALLWHICTDSHVSADLYASLKGQFWLNDFLLQTRSANHLRSPQPRCKCLV